MKSSPLGEFIDRWKSLNLAHKLAVASLLLIFLSFPVAVILTLNKTNPYSKANENLIDQTITNASISFAPSNITVKPQEKFSVAVLLNTGNYNATFADIKLNYDSTKIHATDVLPGPFLANSTDDQPTVNEASGSGAIRFIVKETSLGAKNGTGTIAIINFTALTKESTDQITLDKASVVEALESSSNILKGSTPAQITIQSSQSTSLSLKLNVEGIDTKVRLTTPRQPIQFKLWFDPNITDATSSAISTIEKDMTAVPSVDGSYSGTVTGLQPGNYILLIKGPVHLRQKIGKIVLTPGENYEDLTYSSLKTGDVNGDNEIDGSDLNIINEDINKKTTSSPSDINYDGVINEKDRNLLLQNYGQSGD